MRNVLGRGGRVLRRLRGGRAIVVVVDLDGFGRSEDLGNEVRLVRLAGHGDIGLGKDVLEVDDLECLAAGRSEREGRGGRGGSGERWTWWCWAA